jgi:hypothetical protein
MRQAAPAVVAEHAVDLDAPVAERVARAADAAFRPTGLFPFARPLKRRARAAAVDAPVAQHAPADAVGPDVAVLVVAVAAGTMKR